MSRQATHFQRVNRPITEGSIRPIFGSMGSFQNVPKVITANNANGVQFTIRPPKGEVWEMLYASHKWSTAASGTIALDMWLVDEVIGNLRMIGRYTTNGTVGLGLEITGTSPIRLTNNIYFRFDTTATTGGTSDSVVVVRVL